MYLPCIYTVKFKGGHNHSLNSSDSKLPVILLLTPFQWLRVQGYNVTLSLTFVLVPFGYFIVLLFVRLISKYLWDADRFIPVIPIANMKLLEGEHSRFAREGSSSYVTPSWANIMLLLNVSRVRLANMPTKRVTHMTETTPPVRVGKFYPCRYRCKVPWAKKSHSRTSPLTVSILQFLNYIDQILTPKYLKTIFW